MNILFRALDKDGKTERNHAKEFFSVYSLITEIKKDEIICGRYSVLPYYNEVEANIINTGSKLINSYQEHKYIANFDYYEDIKELTFPTFFSLSEAPDCPLIVKGKTNSLKWAWNSHMFAKNKREAIDISSKLLIYPEIASQDLIYRLYEPLKTFEIGLNGLPFTNEWRFFVLNDEFVANGYYWSCAELIPTETPIKAIELANQIKEIIKIPFYSFDVAEREDGKWRLVEINDGQMAGLSCIDSNHFYNKLSNILVN